MCLMEDIKMKSKELLRLQAIVNAYKENTDRMFSVVDFICRDIMLDAYYDFHYALCFNILGSREFKSDLDMEEVEKSKIDITSSSGCISIPFNNTKDYKAFLFDIRFFTKAGAPHAMQTTMTDTGYSIRQYFGDIDKKILIWEITNNNFDCSADRATKVYMLTEDLIFHLDEDIFNTYDEDYSTSRFEYGPNFNCDTEDFVYPSYVLDALSRHEMLYLLNTDRIGKPDKIL